MVNLKKMDRVEDHLTYLSGITEMLTKMADGEALYQALDRKDNQVWMVFRDMNNRIKEVEELIFEDEMKERIFKKDEHNQDN